MKKKIIGKCKQCGQCCKNIYLDLHFNDEKILKMDFSDKLKEAIGSFIIKNPLFDFSNANKIIFKKDSLHISGIECKALIKKKGKYYCSIHDNKPRLCSNHPSEDSAILKGCGYRKIKVKDEKDRQKKARKKK